MKLRRQGVLRGFRPSGHRSLAIYGTVIRWGLIVGMAEFLLSGCISSAPIIPHPTVVRVPYPEDVSPTWNREVIEELYSVSPLLNPDGRGNLNVIFEQSFLTLMPWEAVRQIEELNELAYARTEDEQNRVLEERERFYKNHVVFKGILVGDFPDVVKPELYIPDGIYLIDDKGNKFDPILSESLDPLVASELDTYMADGKDERIEFLWFGTMIYYGFPRIVFPDEALTRETRALTLYLAIFQKRISFTWIFDPEYELPERLRIKKRRLFRDSY